ncbi:hypothetical protein ACJX0J_026488, partial [Zea mays]
MANGQTISIYPIYSIGFFVKEASTHSLTHSHNFAVRFVLAHSPTTASACAVSLQFPSMFFFLDKKLAGLLN